MLSTSCTRALETHLRETLFEPLRRMATESETKQLSSTSPGADVLFAE